MVYDLEKYRGKRDKVLGVKKTGISFGAWAATVSAIIVCGSDFHGCTQIHRLFQHPEPG